MALKIKAKEQYQNIGKYTGTADMNITANFLDLSKV